VFFVTLALFCSALAVTVLVNVLAIKFFVARAPMVPDLPIE
jgi:hypothetical protein